MTEGETNATPATPGAGLSIAEILAALRLGETYGEALRDGLCRIRLALEATQAAGASVADLEVTRRAFSLTLPITAALLRASVSPRLRDILDQFDLAVAGAGASSGRES